MPSPKEKANTAKPSIISASLTVTGNLESNAELQIAGTVDGDIKGKFVTIVEGAEITGSIHAETIIVTGKVNGTIEAFAVVVGKTGQIVGDIIHKTLQIEAGAYIDGNCRYKTDQIEVTGKTIDPGEDGGSIQG